MKIKKISNRILINFLGILALTFVITIGIFSVLSKEFLITETRKDLRRVGLVIEKNLMNTLEKRANVETDNKLVLARFIADIEVFDQYLQMETIVLSDDTTILYPRKTWTIEQLNRVTKNIRLNETAYVYYRYDLKNERLPIQSLVLLKKYENVNAFRNTGIKAFLISFSISGLLSLGLSYLLSKRIYKPIKKMKTSIADYMLHQTPVTVYESHDEIEALALDFKTLTERVSVLREKQKQFFQNSSHELKTPLMSIQGYAEAIKDGVVEGDDIMKSLDIVISETQRLKTIVDDVIYLSKIENLEETMVYKNHSLVQLIEDAIEVTKPLFDQKKIQVSLQAKNLKPLLCDGDKMKRVFINLLSNGSRYAKTKVIINIHQNEDMTTVDVIDDGPGFEFGQEEMVFDRFYKGPKGGSGIGLALCREIVEQHNGSIVAVNNMDYGAVFKIKLIHRRTS